jgi:maltose alpha-D-glucosyltransferase/alpha-amylase
MKRYRFDRRMFLGKVAAAAGAGIFHWGGQPKSSEKSSPPHSVINPDTESRPTRPVSEWTQGKITGRFSVPPNCPQWAHNAVFYQVYPQSFYDSNGDGIGDLQGIIQKLDYIKSLGVDAIWINPFFESPFGDAGYDISDYYKVAPRYGTNDDARTLFKEAHKRGLRILFDFVASYTSIDHPWFKASALQEPNKRSNWYIWTDNLWLDPPKRFQGAFIKGYGSRNGQYMQNFYYCEPALNYGFDVPDPDQKWELPIDHPDVLAMREEMKNVFRFWMNLGADGFRADMAGALVKSSGVSGNQQFFLMRGDGTKQFWRDIREILNNEYPEAFIVSEWSYPVAALDGCFHADFFHWFEGYNNLFQKESWRILNGYSEGHSFFDADGEGDITFFLTKYMEQYQSTNGKGYISVPIGNHDNARLGNRRNADDLEIIFAFGLTMPGIPFIYYGNEIGMRQMPERWPQVEGAYRPRNGARTPMQWNKGRNLGFSTAPAERLYLPVDPADDAPVVESQERDPDSLLNRTRRLIQLRHAEPALAAYAEFIPLFAREGKYPFIYARAKDDDVILVVLNPAGRAEQATFDLNKRFTRLSLLAGKELEVTNRNGTVSMTVPGKTYALYRLS